jgi:Tfp pilus assembly protein PilX
MPMHMTFLPHVACRSVRESERGAALVVALMATMLLSALGLALILTTTTETKITGNYTHSQEAMYAADAAIERTVQDVLTVPDWNDMLSGAQRSSFVDGAASGTRTLPNGAVIDLAEATNMINCAKLTTCSAADMNAITADRPWGARNPRYQLFAYGPSNRFIDTGTLNSPFYVIVWVADDPADSDDDPMLDGNDSNNKGSGVLLLRAEAWGGRGAHKIIEVTLTRTDSTEIERGYTGQRGQDEQNRRARKAAVQTPGGALTRNELTVQ